MKLYGTTTSPFVRRVRVVAHELGEPVERIASPGSAGARSDAERRAAWIDTAADAGQAALREVSPIRKVPVAVIDGRTLFDSRTIIDWLVTTRGWGTLAPPRDRWDEQNLVNAIDAALESVISLFYLRRDGIAIDGTPFAARQRERADAIFGWLAPRLSTTAFGLAELSCACALDWMDFRQSYDTRRAAALDHVRAAWRERPSLAATRPHA